MIDQDFSATHRHYKGGLYQWLCTAIHSETEEPLVVYRSSDGRVWCRPRAMFEEEERFRPLTDAEKKALQSR